MVFSKRQVPEGFGPKEFDAYPRIVDMGSKHLAFYPRYKTVI